jgi:hypothetical protein
VPSRLEIGDIVEELAVIALAAFDDGFRDTVRYLPLF